MRSQNWTPTHGGKMIPGLKDGMIRGADGGWHPDHRYRKTAYPHHNVTWLLNRMTTTGPDDPLMGLGLEPLDLEPAEIERQAAEYCRQYRLEHLQEMLAGQERVVRGEAAVLLGLRQAVAHVSSRTHGR